MNNATCAFGLPILCVTDFRMGVCVCVFVFDQQKTAYEMQHKFFSIFNVLSLMQCTGTPSTFKYSMIQCEKNNAKERKNSENMHMHTLPNLEIEQN